MQKPTNQKQPTLGQSELTNQPNNHQKIEQEKPENQKQSIVLIGDSVIKDIIPEKMSARKVHKFCYPGKTANEIASDIQTINIRDSPSYVIIHAGTNNLPEQPSSMCLEHIENLCLTVKSKFGNAKIGISEITLREDIHLNDKIKEVNNGMKEMRKKCKHTFIDNSNIKSTRSNQFHAGNFRLLLLYRTREGNKFNSVLESVVEEDCNNIIDLGEGNDSIVIVWSHGKRMIPVKPWK